MKYLFRILALPFVFAISLIWSMRALFTRMIDFVSYGGEWINYSKLNNLKTIKDVYDELIDQQNRGTL